MNITFTELAKLQLEKVLLENQKIKLKYDTEGCGCAVNGVPTLWIVEQLEDKEVEIPTNSISVWIEPSLFVYYDEDMTIDFLPTYNSYQLKSKSEILNPRMSLVSKVKS